jgi:predicted transposase/invertase (TIGR01784 family)
MLGVNLQESRIYQEAKEEGKEEGKEETLAVTVPLLLNAGMTIEQIAQQTGLAIDLIQRAAQPQTP